MAEISYKKTVWVNNVTKLNEENMNHIEDGIEALDVALSTKASVDYVDNAISNAITTALNTPA